MKKPNIATVSIIIGCFIGMCVLILSYTHAVGMMTRAGHTGVLSHVGVWAFEATFFFGSIVVVWSKWNGLKVGITSYLVFLLGVGINLYSNISAGIAKDGQALVFGTVKGVPIDEAVLINTLITCLILAAEMVVTDAIFKRRAIAKDGNQANKPTTEPDGEKGFASRLEKLADAVKIVGTKANANIVNQVKQIGHQSEPNEETAVIEKLDAPAKQTEKPPTTPPVPPTKTPTDDTPVTRALATAKQLYSKGEKVGRVKLARIADVKPSQARKALELLKGELAHVKS